MLQYFYLLYENCDSGGKYQRSEKNDIPGGQLDQTLIDGRTFFFSPRHAIIMNDYTEYNRD